MIKDPFIFLQHILDAIADIHSYTKGFTQNDFKANKLVQDAVIRKIEIIGEAAKTSLFPLEKNTHKHLGRK